MSRDDAKERLVALGAKAGRQRIEEEKPIRDCR